MKQALKFLLLLSISGLLPGCKVAVIVVEGGTVESIDSGTCRAGSVCIVDVDDAYFSETFTATPDKGWYFQKWNSGDRFFCGGSSYAACALSFQGYEESEGVGSIVASPETFYLMPVFVPITTSSSKKWLQPADFIGYTYDQINAVCPGGACSGTLPGSKFNLTGYTWASAEEVSGLFNAYGVTPPFTAPFQTRSGEHDASAAIWLDFKPTGDLCDGDCHFSHYILVGWVRDPAAGGDPAYMAYVEDVDFHNTSTLPPWGSEDLNNEEAGGVGAWFWRPAQNPE